jgi:hypothetical protein
MKQREFLIEAAGFFLCLENGGLSIEEQLKLLEKVCEKGGQIHPPDEVIVWEPFEYWMGDQILHEIYSLAGLLERMYQLGKDGRAVTA